MGFGFPKAERDGLIASDPETFFLPRHRRPALPVGLRAPAAADGRGDARAGRRRLADVHARRCSTSSRSCRAPAARTWALIERQEWGEVRPLLHPYLHFDDGPVARALRGPQPVLAHLREHPTPRPPTEVEVRDGQVYRWVRRLTAWPKLVGRPTILGMADPTLTPSEPHASRWQGATTPSLDQGRRPRRRLHDAERAGGRAGVRHRRLGVARRVPVHPRALPDGLPRPHVDDPAVRRLRQRPADQRALPDDPRPRRRRAVGRLRHADADGPRLRRPDEPRRGRPLRRRDRLRRRHGAPLRRHRPRRRHDLDDDQRPGRPGLLHDARRRRARRASTPASSTARCRPTSSRSTSPRRSGSSGPSRTCG